MPSVPNVKLQAAGPRVIIQPPPGSDIPDIPAIELPEPEKPEPAIPIADIPIPTQEELAARGLASQTIARRNQMTPSTDPPPKDTHYKFTDRDRKEAEAARKANKYDWEASALDEALIYLAEIRAEVERGGLILEKRISQQRVETVKCYSCENIINISEGRWAGMRTRNNFETNIPESAYACSAACYLKLQREFVHPLSARQQ
jgi:hypothetical protein